MSGTPSELDTPPVVLDLADSCVRFVKRALRIELDYTPETLPILDHYLREAQGVERDEIINLVAPAAGAYFGEVVRRQLGPSRWHWVSDEFDDCRIEFDRCFLSFNPIGSALEAVLGAEAEGYGSTLALLPEDQNLVRESLERTGEVSEDDYYRLAVRFEVIEQVVALLVEKAIAKDELSRRFGPEVYAALREQKSSGILH
ncbi:MAG: hypothetical protein RLZZ450_2941 [Pseudomonadota bacterium]|jgi:hypothetical protein